MTTDTAAAPAQQPESSAGTPRYGTFMTRMYATMVDVIILLLVLAILFPNMGIDISKASPETLQAMEQLNSDRDAGRIGAAEFAGRMREIMVELRGGPDAVMMEFVLQTCVLVVCYILFWRYCRPTPGKRLFKLAIVDSKTLMEASTRQAVIRFLGYTVSTIPLGLGFFWILFNKQKQAWHDLMSGTLVIHTVPLEPDWKKKRFKRQTILAIILLLGFLIYRQVAH